MPSDKVVITRRLARSASRNVLAVRISLTTSDVNTRPGPVRASTGRAEDVDLVSTIGNITSDVLNGEVGDRDTIGRSTSGRTVLVILLDNDTVVGDVGEGDAGVGDVGDFTGSVVDGFDADTVGAVLDSAVFDGDAGDGVVVTAADGANGDTVTAGAHGASELDVGTAVDGEAVILVVDGGAGDGDSVRGTDVESIGVVTALGVASRVVDGDVGDGEAAGAVDGEALHRGVEDRETRDGGVSEIVRVEELGLGDAAVASLSVPPARAIRVESGAAGSLDSDASAGDGEERAVPFGVLPGGFALEDDLDKCQWLAKCLDEWIRTVVSSLRSVMSKVVPEGTAMALRTMVEQEVLLAEAESASVKMQSEETPEVSTELVEEVEAAVTVEPEAEVAAAEVLTVVDLAACALTAAAAELETATVGAAAAASVVTTAVTDDTVDELCWELPPRWPPKPPNPPQGRA